MKLFHCPRIVFSYIVVLVLLCLSPSLVAQQIEPETLNRLKAATVFVKTNRGSGSGFLIKQESNHGFIATNHHVVITNSGRFSSRINVVFNSGTKAEKILKATVVAHDRKKDLAILRVDGKKLPNAIELTEPEISETLGVFIIGFPFGEALGSDDRENPSLTISSGSISSLRKSKQGKLESVQLDGDLNPGNSGGPIVTREGELVGVAVATLFGTQISWAIPAADLKDLCNGRVDKVTTKVDSISDEKNRLQVTAELMDPLRRMSDLSFIAVLEADAGEYKKDGGELRRSKPLSFKTAKLVSMSKEKDKETTVSGSIELTGKANEEQRYVVQLSFNNRSGERVYLKPLVRTIEFGVDSDDTGTVAEEKLIDQFSTEDEIGNPSAFRVELEEVATGFAFNDETGDLAVIDAKEGIVRRYTADYLNGDNDHLEDPVKVGQRPVSICFKRFRDASFYAVACYGDEKIYLIDSKTFKVVEKIEVGHSDITRIDSSHNPKDPNLYYVFGRKYDSELGRFNLEVRSNVGLAIDNVWDFSVSSSGRYVYRRGPGSPSGFDCFERVNGFNHPAFRHIVNEHRSTKQYVPGPFDSFTATGSDLHSGNLKRKIASVDFDVMCFFDDRPVIAGVNRETSNIVAASLNSYKRFGSVRLPKDFSKSLRRPENIPLYNNGSSLSIKYQPRMFADKRFNRLILAYRKQLLLIPLSALDVVEEPFLLAEITTPNEAVIDRKNKIMIRPIDPDVAVEIENKPKSMKKIKGGFVWTPGPEEYGNQEFELKYTHKDLTKSGVLPISVSRPHVNLPFADIGGINIYAENSAVCWGDKEAKQSIAVVDLKTYEVIHHHKFNFEVKHAAIDNQFVYVLPENSSLLLVLNRKDYSEHKRVFTSNPGKHIQTTSKTAVLTHAGGLYSLYDVPDFKLRASYRDTGQHFRSTLRAVQVDGYWRIGSRMFDKEINKQVLYQPESYHVVQFEGNNQFSRMLQFSSWGRFLNGRTLMSATNRTVGTLSTYKSVIVERKPLVASLIADSKSNVIQVEIALHDVATGQLIQKVPMTKINKRISSYHSLPFVCNGSSLYFSVDGKLFWFNSEQVSEGKDPPRFIPIQKKFILPATGAKKLEHEVVGGQGPYHFSIPNTKDYVTVDQKTGTILINDKLAGEVERLIINQCQNTNTKPNEALKILRDRYRGQYELTTGETFDDDSTIPAPIPIQINARDANGQNCSLYYCVFLTVDPKLPRIKPVVTRVPSLTVDEERIKNLEQKVSRLETQIEMLIEMVKENK